jgi:hypothetical protein
MEFIFLLMALAIVPFLLGEDPPRPYDHEVDGL